MQEYCSAAYELNSTEPQPLLQEILLPQSEFWMKNSVKTTNSSIPWKTREDIVQAFILKKRCEEEMDMLRSDMVETIGYWFNDIQSITKELAKFECPTNIFHRGLRSILLQMKQKAQLKHSQAVAKLSKLCEIPSTICNTISASSDEIDYDTDSDTDVDIVSDDSDSDFF